MRSSESNRWLLLPCLVVRLLSKSLTVLRSMPKLCASLSNSRKSADSNARDVGWTSHSVYDLAYWLLLPTVQSITVSTRSSRGECDPLSGLSRHVRRTSIGRKGVSPRCGLAAQARTWTMGTRN
jgi:hypothetical protein